MGKSVKADRVNFATLCPLFIHSKFYFMGVSIYLKNVEHDTVFQADLTHNLRPMALACGIREILWASYGDSVSEIIDTLNDGIHSLKKYPITYQRLNPANGWGSYDVLLEVAENLLEKCYQYQTAKLYCNN